MGLKEELEAVLLFIYSSSFCVMKRGKTDCYYSVGRKISELLCLQKCEGDYFDCPLMADLTLEVG